MTPEEKREYHRHWYKKNKAEKDAKNRAWALAHPDRIHEHARKSYYKYQEKNIERVKAYRRNNSTEESRIKEAEYSRRYREHHKEELKERDRKHRPARNAYLRLHPEISRLKMQRWRARHAAVESTLTSDQWSAIQAAYHGQCAYCGEPSPDLTMDHVVPISLGGPNIASNIVPACRSCNSAKHTKPPPILPAVRLMI